MKVKQKRGFTILELLVSMAVAVVLMVCGMAVLNVVTRGYRDAHEWSVAEREARAVFHQVERDLNSLVMSERIWVYASKAGWPTDSIGFFGLKPEPEADWVNGDLVALRYYVSSIQIDGVLIQCLMRGVDSEDELYETIRDGEEANWLSRQLEQDEPIGFAVLAFEVKPMTWSDGQWVEWDRKESMPPDCVKLRLVIAKPGLLERLNRMDHWGRSQWLGDYKDAPLQKGLEVFETKIDLEV